ncbi:MAG: cell wall-binding repeat-containing protein, partial [Nitriliruptorales bacterium]
DPIASPWTPPAAVTSAAFTTLRADAPGGGMGNWRVSHVARPLTFAVEQAVVDRLGLDRVKSGITAWNGIPGSTFSARVATVVDDGVRTRRRDGVSRVFLTDDACAGRHLARAHIWPAWTDVHDGERTVYVTEVDIGVCETLDHTRAHLALRHEVAHGAGLGHLCEPGDDCWEEEMGSGHGCRVMYRRARPCVRVEAGDLDAFRHLYPVVPRLGGGDASATSVATSQHLFPTRRTADAVVLVREAQGPELVLAAAAAAGALAAPVLLVGDSCTDSPVADELNRAAELDATVVVVGGLSPDCGRLLFGWELPTVEIGDAASLAEWLLGVTHRREIRLVTRDLLDADPGLVATIAAAAGRDRVPLVFTSASGVDRDLVRLVDGGGVAQVAAFVSTSGAGVVPTLRRLVATRSETVDAATPQRLAADTNGRRVVLTGRSWAEAAVAAALAGANGWPVLSTDESLDPATVEALRVAGDGVVVAGERAFPSALQRDASQTVAAVSPGR